MKKIFQRAATVVLGAAFVLSTTSASAQQDKSKRPSPPATVTQTVKGTTITIDYSRPSVKGRNVWEGNFAPYGKVWRTGANEATIFTVDKDVKVNGKTLPAGKYSLFTIPGEKEWTIIFNKTAEQWGAYKYDSTADQLRVTAKPKANAMTEQFTINITPKGVVELMWDKVKVPFTVK